MKDIFLALTSFCSFYIYRKVTKDLETVVSILNRGALEESNIPHIRIDCEILCF